MFRTDLLSIIRGLDTEFTATGICHTIYDDCLLAESLSETRKVVYQNKVEKYCILLASIIRMQIV